MLRIAEFAARAEFGFAELTDKFNSDIRRHKLLLTENHNKREPFAPPFNLKTKYLLPSSRRKTARHLPQRGRQIKAPPSGELSALLTEGVCLHSEQTDFVLSLLFLSSHLLTTRT